MIYSQALRQYLKDDYLQKNWHKGSLMFVAGACDGQVETLSHHYDKFKKVFPNANDQYWNPAISWENKWADDTYKTEKFLFSSTALVWTTDGYHMFKMGQKASIFTAVTIDIGKSRHKKKFKHYIVDFVFYSGCYTAGFYSTYGILYR